MTIKWPLVVCPEKPSMAMDSDETMAFITQSAEATAELVACANAGARLPRFEDGPIAVPGAHAYEIITNYRTGEKSIGLGPVRVVVSDEFSEDDAPTTLAGAYSTHEAAEAAMREPTQ